MRPLTSEFQIGFFIFMEKIFAKLNFNVIIEDDIFTFNKMSEVRKKLRRHILNLDNTTLEGFEGCIFCLVVTDLVNDVGSNSLICVSYNYRDILKASKFTSSVVNFENPVVNLNFTLYIRNTYAEILTICNGIFNNKENFIPYITTSHYDTSIQNSQNN